jgi:SdrD B-like domain
MKPTKNLFAVICTGITLFAGAFFSSAQQAALATNSSGRPFFQSVSLDSGEKQKMDFSVRAAGSVSGRVFNDAELTKPFTPHGIAGVRVTLRSTDTDYENFALEQLTDEIGAYKFLNLKPGKYSIVIDPADLPKNFHGPTVTDSTIEVKASEISSLDLGVTARREIKGIVFIDKNGDGRYNYGKETPVEGAYIVADGRFTTSDSNGAYTFRDLPAGRTALLVSWPQISENTHVVLDLADGPVTNRVVNIPKGL